MLTTHPGLPAAQAAGLLRSRWTQENFFKYMRAEFGLDTLSEHALVAVDPDAWVVNPLWRVLEKALKKERNTVGNLRRKRALLADAGSAAARDLQARIAACDRTIAGLVLARKKTDEHVQAGTCRRPGGCRPCPRRCAADGHAAHDRLPGGDGDDGRGRAGPGQSRYRAQPAQVAVPQRREPAPDEAARTLTVRLLHQATRAQDRALAPLLDELNATRTVFPGTQLRLRYEMLSDDPSPTA